MTTQWRFDVLDVRAPSPVYILANGLVGVSSRNPLEFIYYSAEQNKNCVSDWFPKLTLDKIVCWNFSSTSYHASWYEDWSSSQVYHHFRRNSFYIALVPAVQATSSLKLCARQCRKHPELPVEQSQAVDHKLWATNVINAFYRWYVVKSSQAWMINMHSTLVHKATKQKSQHCASWCHYPASSIVLDKHLVTASNSIIQYFVLD